jgi:hypothetical protein
MSVVGWFFLFNNSGGNSQVINAKCIVRNIVYGEMDRTGVLAVIAYFRVLSQHSFQGTQGNHKISVRMTGVWARIQAMFLLNMSHYRCLTYLVFIW